MLPTENATGMSRFWKLFPGIALAVAVGILIAGVVMAVYSERSYKEQQIKDVSVHAQILASTVTAALVFDDQAATEEYVNALRANPEILSAAVYNSRGALVASYSRAEPVPERVKIQPPYFVKDRLVVIVPVKQDIVTLGAVYLEAITEPALQRFLRYGAVGLLITMAFLVAAVFGVAHTALTRANTELKSRASDLAQANRMLQTQMREREKAEEALRQSQKMEAIGQLSGGIAHDFNNLLTIVKGNLQLLQRRLSAGRTDVSRYVELALDGVNRATNVTQRILAFSRRQPLSPKPVNISRLIVDIELLLRHSSGDGISVETRLTSDWWALCDPNQMENVVLNLVINARDAMPSGGRIVIETANVSGEQSVFDDVAPGDYVQLSVSDTGIGMSPEVLSKAIDPFFTTKPQGQGTGLGLSMIFGYIKQSKGHLHIASQPGKGTTVTILLPRHIGADIGQTTAAVVEAPAGEASAMAQPEVPTVFVVEDEVLVRTLAVEAIREAGYRVLEEGDGKAALDVLKSATKIDLLVSDVRLPGINGFQLAEYGLAHREAMKVVLMTGFTQDPLPQKLAEAGIRVLYKPYDLEELTAWVHESLSDRAA
jgi:signal transduction histidine kinase/ActR/RegA family two-component response regulator